MSYVCTYVCRLSWRALRWSTARRPERWPTRLSTPHRPTVSGQSTAPSCSRGRNSIRARWRSATTPTPSTRQTPFRTRNKRRSQAIEVKAIQLRRDSLVIIIFHLCTGTYWIKKIDFCLVIQDLNWWVEITLFNDNGEVEDIHKQSQTQCC